MNFIQLIIFHHRINREAQTQICKGDHRTCATFILAWGSNWGSSNDHDWLRAYVSASTLCVCFCMCGRQKAEDSQLEPHNATTISNIQGLESHLYLKAEITFGGQIYATTFHRVVRWLLHSQRQESTTCLKL